MSYAAGVTRPSPPRPGLSDRASSGQSSAIRDLLDQANQPGMISLAGGLPDASHFPTTRLAELASTVLRRDGERVLQYGATAGDAETRQSLGALFGDHIDPARVVVTTGSQAALDLIARVVVNRGDQVIVGDPDYLGALQVFRSYGADVRPVAIDASGLDTTQLEDELKWGLRPKCLYLVPHFHNPTGATMSEARRSHLDALSTRYGFLVIEDDPYRELYYEGAGPVDLSRNDELTVRLRSTSKTLAPGLRIGALAGPQWLIEPIITAKQSVDLHTSSLAQALVAEALRAPWMPSHLCRLRSLYGAKRDVLAAALRTTFGDAVHFDCPAGGMFLWARFDHVADTAEWLSRCLDHGVCFVPGTAFAVAGDLSSYARLSFATSSPDQLADAVTRLHTATPRF